MIVPQLASGGCTPIDRNDSADSVSMLSAAISGRNTMTDGSTFGSTSRRRMRQSDAPSPMLACRNSRSSQGDAPARAPAGRRTARR